MFLILMDIKIRLSGKINSTCIASKAFRVNDTALRIDLYLCPIRQSQFSPFTHGNNIFYQFANPIIKPHWEIKPLLRIASMILIPLSSASAGETSQRQNFICKEFCRGWRTKKCISSDMLFFFMILSVY